MEPECAVKSEPLLPQGDETVDNLEMKEEVVTTWLTTIPQTEPSSDEDVYQDQAEVKDEITIEDHDIDPGEGIEEDCRVERIYEEYLRGIRLKTQSLINTVEKVHQCSVCEKRFSQRCDLTRHILIHTGQKRYQCTLCAKRYSQPGNLKRHLLTHTGEKPYQCDVCKKRFPMPYKLKRHLLSHTGEKPYQCDVCKKRFSMPDYLNRHLLTHTGEKPYQCDVCKKTFTQRGSLIKHLVIIHKAGTP